GRGALDTGFGPGGSGFVLSQLTPGVPVFSLLPALALQPDAKILLGGGGVDRFNPDGSLDSSFNVDPSLVSEIDGSVLAVQSDGKILTSRLVPLGDNAFEPFLARL